MFNFFKKSNVVSDISWLGIDIHSHILPGIDDGAQVMEQSVDFIHRMHSLGFEKLICTPHIFKELYPNSADTIFPVLQSVKENLILQDRLVKISAAAEYMIDNSFEITDGLLCLDGKYILIEMSYLSESPNIEQVVFELQVSGYTVVLAHPERYTFYHKNIYRYQRLKEIGCLFQLNILSILGYYGRDVKQAADYLIKVNYYDLAGSDLHHDRHLGILEKNIYSGELHKLIGTYPFKNREFFM